MTVASWSLDEDRAELEAMRQELRDEEDAPPWHGRERAIAVMRRHIAEAELKLAEAEEDDE